MSSPPNRLAYKAKKDANDELTRKQRELELFKTQKSNQRREKEA